MITVPTYRQDYIGYAKDRLFFKVCSKRVANFHGVFRGFLKRPAPFDINGNWIRRVAPKSIDINFIAQKAEGVSKNHEKLHENLPIFFEQTLDLR